MKRKAIAGAAVTLGMWALTQVSDAQAPQRDAANDVWTAQWVQRGGAPPLDRLRYLLDRGVIGDGLPAAPKAAFLEIFDPAKGGLQRLLDEQFRKAQEQLQIGARSAAKSSVQPLVAVRWRYGASGGAPTMWPVAASDASPARGRLPSGAVRWLRIQAAAGAGSASFSGSADAGNGMTADVSGTQATDTDTTVAEGNAFDLTVKGTAKGATGKLGIGDAQVARVDRCPGADGVVPGSSQWRASVTANVTLADGTSHSVADAFSQQVVAEARVGDDGVIRDARAEFETTSSTTSPPAVTLRVAGTAMWNPHGDADPSVEIKACTASDGAAVQPDICRLFATVSTRRLNGAYLRAENQWNFVAADAAGKSVKPSKCVTVEFMPKSGTLHGKPNESVSVAARLVTVNGRQATSGTFDELAPVRGGDVQRNGAPASPNAPAPLAYETPAQAWPLAAPPGFDVVKARSRAGAFMRAHAEEREYRWLLKPGPRLTIHNLWQSGLAPYGTLLSDATFPLDLAENADGTLSGQTVVPRTYHTEGVCRDDGRWTETWLADGKYDETGENLILKIRYRASQKEAVGVCPEVGAKAHTLPALSSEGVRTPLDNFTLPMQEGATRQFAFTFSAVAKNVIDVTIAPADDAGR